MTPEEFALIKDVATDREIRIVNAVFEHGSHRKAAEAVGCVKSNVAHAIESLRKRAAKLGLAPGHFTDGVAPGYRMGKVTIQRSNGVVERIWERQHPEQESLERIIARCEERTRDFERLPAIVLQRDHTRDNLANFLGLFDLHIGENIRSDDPNACWDIATAKRVIMAAVQDALDRSPPAGKLILCFGGDAAHYDGLSPVTPKSRHVLHSDGDFDAMVDAVLDVATFAIDRGLETHPQVDLIWAEGNHDEASSVFMRKMLARIYGNEPRLHVVQSRLPYYAVQFGKSLIGVHHGHKVKLTRFAGIFANLFREMWGATRYAYGHRGHEHHIHEKEQDGMVQTQHPTLAPSDDYAAGMGLISKRGCMRITYHAEYGEVDRATTRPEMLGVL
jgi:AcrR family transcriptional regulator